MGKLGTSLVLAAAVLTGCGGTPSIVDKDVLVVAVKADQPGLAERTGDGVFRGFDVDVAAYVAARLGKKVTFVETTSEGREAKLRGGAADMVVASYSISPERKRQVTFAGPYYVSHQDILVRSGETGIRNVRDLKGRKLCEAQGSISTSRIVDGRRIPARLVPARTYGECVELLRSGAVEAVSTGDLVLAGFAARERGAFTIVNAPFTAERYGIAVPLGDVAGCEQVNRAITAMYQDGTAARLLDKWFGASGLRLSAFVPEFEGCPS
ncbi:glutamate ABC transporter substrate-binding protein [Nonomuraea sp. NBC_01738]|uniref:glutamate ABC transporter substrate-binding protein n=1 Tax=Nonomuraea sp. NBC_01738 TaxID=2976003 RepID=UPI002E15933C|nr:glutamate ABC transporter substrate-binding protein [Nonomuraea sp. NBC_01738]